MRRLPKPDFDAGDVYTSCVSGVTGEAAVARYQSAADALSQLAQLYDSRAAISELHQFVAAEWGENAQVVAGNVTKGDLTSLYTGNMVGRNQPARSYYDRLMLLAPLGKCPYCGFGHVSTLDHFLSKARYPSFSVLPVNLVPSCSDCNHGKGSGVIDAANQIPHPYYETAFIETDDWLFASVEETSPASVSYFASPPDTWPVALSNRVLNYFRDMNLASRFSVEAASELISLSDYLRLLPSSNLIGVHLNQVSSAERIIRKNTWKAALYKALAESGWYLGGGWQQRVNS